MNLIEKNKPLTLSLCRRTKSLVNNCALPQDYQSNTQSNGRKSTDKLIENNYKTDKHNKISNMRSDIKNNPQHHLNQQQQISNNSQVKRKHIRLIKRKARNNESEKNSQAADFQKKQESNICVLENKQKSTLNKLVQMSIKQHDPTLCVCAYCSCGRHLCKVHLTKPYSSQQFSSYNSDYNKKKPIQNLKFNLLDSFKGQQIGIDPLSQYAKEYSSKQTEISDKFLPHDLLHVGGPFDGKTTYIQNYPKYKTQKTELIKPLGGKIDNFPFSGNSNYQKQYTPKQVKRLEQVKADGNIKLGSEPWIGKSTYNELFTTPNKSYIQKWRSKLSDLPRPKYESQFDTVYKNNYIPLRPTICAAIPQLFTRTKTMSHPKNLGTFRESEKLRSINKQTI